MSVWNAATRYTWVHAYLPDGTRDTSFGDSGIVDFPGDRRRVVGALAQPDGDVLVAESGNFVYPPDAPLIRRVTADGRSDPSFGSGGSIEPHLGGATGLTDMELLSDGRFLVAGMKGEHAIVVGRYLPDGSPDSTFGAGGVREIPGDRLLGARLAIQPDGGLIVTTIRLAEPVAVLIARVSPDGELDQSFGGGSLAPVEYGNASFGASPVIYRDTPAVVAPDGRIRLAIGLTLPGEQVGRTAVVGLTDEGHPDATFGLRGLALGPQPELPIDDDGFVEAIGGETVDAAVVDARGGILVAGEVWSGDTFASDTHALVRRFNPNGSLDLAFGDRGRVSGGPWSLGYGAIDQKIATRGDRLYVAEYVTEAKYGSFHSTRLRAFDAGYDDDPPRIWVARGCRWLRVRIRDLSELEIAVVRSGHRVLRRTRLPSFGMRPPAGRTRISVAATDLADNSSRKTVRLPRCPA